MNIVHICLAAPYRTRMGYQENMLVKYHAKHHKVSVFSKPYKKEKQTGQEHGAVIYRMQGGIYESLCAEKPDFVFIHGTQFKEAKAVARYLKESGTPAVADNHCDYSNSARNPISKHLFHKRRWKKTTQALLPYVKTIYGVLPARVDFVRELYDVPKEKTSLLLMGADSEYVEKAQKKSFFSENIRITIVSGGKIDSAKRQTANLIRVVRKLPEVGLVLFGSLDKEAKKAVKEELCDRILFLGWQSQKEYYSTIKSADIAIYPGRHSVLWEEAAGLGVPLVVKDWEGTHHVAVKNQEGHTNCLFLKEDTEEEITHILMQLLADEQLLSDMKKAAQEAAGEFQYDVIAGRVLE